MANGIDIEIYRDGGTIEFCISGSNCDGSYRLQSPFLGTPEPLFRDGRQLKFGSTEEVALLNVLRKWLADVSTKEVVAALAELDQLKVWIDLPPRLADVVPMHYVRTVIRRLASRCGG